MRYVKKLEAKRVYLSPARVEDADLYITWLNDPEVTNFLGASHNTLTFLNEKKMLEEILSKKDPFFAIIDKQSDKLIGNVGLFNIDRLSQKSEIGIFIGNKDFRNKGIGQEVMTLMVDYGFNILNLHSIYLNTYSFNERAIAAYKKIGFKEVGRLRESYQVGRKYFDTVIMDILYHEFKSSSILDTLKKQKIIH